MCSVPRWVRLWMAIPSLSAPNFVSISTCLSQGFCSCTNIMTKKQVGEERVYSTYFHIAVSSPKEVRTGTQAGQEAETDVEAMDRCFLLAWGLCWCFLWYLLPLRFSLLSLVFCWWCFHLWLLISFLGFLSPGVSPSVLSLLFLFPLLYPGFFVQSVGCHFNSHSWPRRTSLEGLWIQEYRGSQQQEPAGFSKHLELNWTGPKAPCTQVPCRKELGPKKWVQFWDSGNRELGAVRGRIIQVSACAESWKPFTRST